MPTQHVKTLRGVAGGGGGIGGAGDGPPTLSPSVVASSPSSCPTNAINVVKTSSSLAITSPMQSTNPSSDSRSGGTSVASVNSVPMFDGRGDPVFDGSPLAESADPAEQVRCAASSFFAASAAAAASTAYSPLRRRSLLEPPAETEPSRLGEEGGRARILRVVRGAHLVVLLARLQRAAAGAQTLQDQRARRPWRRRTATPRPAACPGSSTGAVFDTFTRWACRSPACTSAKLRSSSLVVALVVVGLVGSVASEKYHVIVCSCTSVNVSGSAPRNT